MSGRRGDRSRRVGGGSSLNRGSARGERGGRGDFHRGGDTSHERGGPRGRGRGLHAGGPQTFSYLDGSQVEPSRAVTEAENTIVSSLDVSRLSLGDGLPFRPGYGKQGTPIELWTNYIEILPNPNIEVYRYDISVTPEATGKKRQRIIELLLVDGYLSAYSNSVASDFKSNLISCRELLTQDLRKEVIYRQENEDPAPVEGTQRQRYNIQLQLTGQLNLSDLIDYVTSTNAGRSLTAREEFIQALNIVVGHESKIKPTHEMMSIGSNRHFTLVGPSSANFNLGGGLEAWRGFFTSIRTAAQRVLLNVQVKHTVAYKAGPLRELIDLYGSATGRNLVGLDKFLKGVRVETTHLPERRNRANEKVIRVKTISGLATQRDGKNLAHPPRIRQFGGKAQEVEFWKTLQGNEPSKGGYVSVHAYFKQEYNLDVSLQYPVVNVGNKENPSYLPLDVCKVLSGKPANVKLSPNQTANMINFAVRRPFENAQSIAGPGQQTLGLNPVNATLHQFIRIVDNHLIKVPGRILAGPDVLYGAKKTAKTNSGSWNLNQLQFYQSRQLYKWSVMWLWSGTVRDPWERNGSALRSLVMAFTASLKSSGIQAEDPRGPPIVVQMSPSVEQTNANLELGFRSAQEKDISFLLVILVNDSSETYKRVKQLGDVKYGVQTVCVVGSKFNKERGREQYFANVALKFNLKLGGTNQTLQANKLGMVSDGKTMVVGIDVTHPAPGSSSHAKSVAGMVASIRSDLGQFPAILRIQTGRQERVSELQHMLETRLDLWKRFNENNLPDNIIVFRDGVSEGQYQMVLDEELPELRKACAKKYSARATKASLPAISVIVVGKRHQTRFYPTDADANLIDTRSSNPKNGTVVDRGITEPRYWDFYLQAHTALQGTARPAHYFIVHDEIFTRRPFPPAFVNLANGQEVLETITHNMCYLFGRATKAVSICPPAYYADLVCERARCYVSEAIDASETTSEASSQTSAGATAAPVNIGALEVHKRIKDTMFYI